MSTGATPQSREETFRSLSLAEASAYAQNRLDYHPRLYEILISHHTTRGGKLGTLIDVGCGPGMVARTLGKRFAHAIGLDASPGMIATAKELEGASGSGEPIRFEVSGAEELRGMEDESVDLITAANAAHWFDMPVFWARAAQVLKPGGSVAMWTHRGMRIAPSVPNAVAIQAAMDTISMEHLAPFMLPGNLHARSLYVNLPLPWGVDSPIAEFDKESLFRLEWGTGGEGALEAVEEPEASLDALEAMIETASPVKRWREANNDKAGTAEDVVRIMRRETERLLHEAGVEKGKETVQRVGSGVLLVVKKTA